MAMCQMSFLFEAEEYVTDDTTHFVYSSPTDVPMVTLTP